MKERIVQKNFVKKLSSVRKLVKSRFPEENMQNVKEFSKLAHYHYDKKHFMLIGKEREFYDFLIENSYNPYTVYRWMLLENIPEDIKFQLKENRINQKQALSKAFERRQENDTSLALSIKEMGLKLVRCM